MTQPQRYALVCRDCGHVRAPGVTRYACDTCGGELVVRYLAATTQHARGPGIWRFADRLPGDAGRRQVSLGEGDTPLVPVGDDLRAMLGGAAMSVKCEHMNPTGSFKDRIAAVAVTLSAQRSIGGLVGTSSGNGGAAAAAYAARAGLPFTVFALADTVEQKLLQIRSMGARVVLVRGVGHDAHATEAAAQAIAGEAARRRLFPFLTGGRFSPEAMEGAKTIAYELAEQAFDATHVYAPVGGGGLLAAVGRGYRELLAAGDIAAMPRIIGVQPAGCPTMSPALAGDFSGLHAPSTTTVSGLQVAVLFDGRGAVEAIRLSEGHLTEVPDPEVWEAQRLLAHHEGILVEPAGATALAGALADAREGRLGADARAVVLATGAGYKDSAALRRLSPSTEVVAIDADEIGGVLDG